MLISDSKRFVFVHIQKTAGTSLGIFLKESVEDLKSCGKKHTPLRELEERYDSYFKFCFVRNPFDRLVSWYAMIERLRHASEKTEVQRQVLDRAKSFSDFILNCEEITSRSGWKPFKYNQIDYITDRNGIVAVDYIGRFETLEKDIAEIREILGIAKDRAFPHINRSDHKNYRDYYDSLTKKVVEERFARDLEYFGYAF
jgi:hypothetical protein